MHSSSSKQIYFAIDMTVLVSVSSFQEAIKEASKIYSLPINHIKLLLAGEELNQFNWDKVRNGDVIDGKSPMMFVDHSILDTLPAS